MQEALKGASGASARGARGARRGAMLAEDPGKQSKGFPCASTLKTHGKCKGKNTLAHTGLHTSF